MGAGTPMPGHKGVKHRAQPTAALSKQDLNESVHQASEDPETREVGFGGLGKERAKRAGEMRDVPASVHRS